jgi:hypothetical protein
VKHYAAFLALLVVVVAGCSRDETPPKDTVYKLAVRIEDVPPESRAKRSFLEQRRHVEWVDPASGRWRIESRGPLEPGSREIEDATFIFTGSACVDLVEYGPSIREGSRRFLGPCVETQSRSSSFSATFARGVTHPRESRPSARATSSS